MPERPKKRKNKNKRKNNKNNGIDLNKNNISDSTDNRVDESCSSFLTEITDDNRDKEEYKRSESGSEIIKSDVTQVFEKTEIGNEVILNTSVLCGSVSKEVTADEVSHVSTLSAEINYKNSSISEISHDSNIIDKNDIIQIDIEENQTELTNVGLDVSSDCIKPLNVVSDNNKVQDVKESEVNSDRHEIINLEDQITEEHGKKEKIEIINSSEQILENPSTIQLSAEISEEIVPQLYIVETPEPPSKIKSKLNNGKKSKSCDDDDSPTIVEVTDDLNVDSGKDNSLAILDSSNMIITEDSDIEWEKVDHFNLTQAEFMKGVLSSDTIPLNIVHCEQTKSLSPEDEKSLRNFLKTLNLSSNPSDLHSENIKTEIEQIINREVKYRLRKKGMVDDNMFCKPGTSRSLAVIDEEGSGDSSKTSRRHSYLSDKKSDSEELEDEVFERKQLKSLETSTSDVSTNTSNRRLIPQPCIRVDAKLKEPDVTEARGDWSMKTIEKMTGAELVYLTDSSSSTSSIYDVNEDIDKGEETDVSVRMITPTIEVTDTESLLSNTFLTQNNEKDKETLTQNDITAVDDMQILDNKERSEEQNNPLIISNSQNNPHEIVVLSTDNITTNLFVKDVDESETNSELKCLSQNEIDYEDKNVPSANTSKPPKDVDNYDLEIKVLKCELNDAINNLIKEVISDSENVPESSKGTIVRQDSSSSVDSSQCTAKYNPTHSSLNDVSNILHDAVDDNMNKENLQTSADSSHVKDVLQSITPNIPHNKEKVSENCKQPCKLKDICLEKITSFPFGDKILEELADVSERLQNMSVIASERNKLAKTQTSSKQLEHNSNQLKLKKTADFETIPNKENPPPILPRKSSLKLTQEEQQKLVTTKSEKVYECLSPSQKMLMEKTNTYIQKDFKSQPNINTTWTESGSSSNKVWNKDNFATTVSPMKSETGSRLLALLRDTSISNNLNLQSSDNKPLHHMSRVKPNHSETFSKRLLNEIDSTKYFEETKNEKKVSYNNFKPIPPPKPKKVSTYFYESDESSNFRENSFKSMQTNKKIFHYSTGNLSKEIENDISTIQNMHRYCSNARDQTNEFGPRRPSLPKDLCDQQMEYIRQKEKEVDAEIRRLEQENCKLNRRGPKAPMVQEDDKNKYRIFDSNTKSFVKKDFTSMRLPPKSVESGKLSSLFSSSQEELHREKMYTEYVNQMAEREQRKQQKIIKVTQTPGSGSTFSRSMPLLEDLDLKINNPIEQEFISKARERWFKLGIRDPETEDERDNENSVYQEPRVIEHKVKVIEAGEEKDVKRLPSHMQEFVKFTVCDKDREAGSPGESDADQAPAHVVVLCAVVILVLAVGKFLLRLLRNK